MELFTNQVLAGIATGAIYACMALAVVMIYQAIDHLNFAQGEMAMFSTFISWQLMQWGVPYWGAFVLAVAFSFAGGVVIERLDGLKRHGRGASGRRGTASGRRSTSGRRFDHASSVGRHHASLRRVVCNQ